MAKEYRPNIHAETAAALELIATIPDPAEAAWQSAHRAHRKALTDLRAAMDQFVNMVLDADEAEDDPALSSRLATLANSIGAFRHLTEKSEQASADVLRHFRQIRGDIKAVDENAKHYRENGAT